MTTPEFSPLGTDGILVRFARQLSDAANTRALGFRDQVTQAALPGVTEVASSLVSVRVAFDPATTTRAQVTQALEALLAQSAASGLSPRRLWHIPVAFGGDNGPQLREAADLAGVSAKQAVAEMTATPLRVIAIGFAPGQPYLGMLPDHWDIARQSELTPHMPSGAIVVAVRQLIIFCADAPTGWRHIGQSAFRVYQPESPEPFAFAPGDAVQFHAIADSDLSALQNRTDTNGGARCEVLR